MFESTGQWLVVGPSALQRRLQLAAALICFALAGVLGLKACLAPYFTLLIVAAVLNAAVGAWVFFLWRRGPATAACSAVRIDGDGALWLKGMPMASEPIFVSSWMVALKTPKKMTVLWCDALAPDDFRQVVVAARWSTGPAPVVDR